MNPRKLVTELSNRPVKLQIAIEATMYPGALYLGRRLSIPYFVKTLSDEDILTNQGDEVTARLNADQFSFSFDDYIADGYPLIRWVLDQISLQLLERFPVEGYLLKATEPPVYLRDIPDEYFAAQIFHPDHPDIEWYISNSHVVHLIHWSNFFEKEDPKRKVIHNAYQEFHRSKINT